MGITFIPLSIRPIFGIFGPITHLAAGSRIGEDVLATEALVLPGDDVVYLYGGTRAQLRSYAQRMVDLLDAGAPALVCEDEDE